MLELLALSPEWVEPLTDFFLAIKAAGDEHHFHPHPLTASHAEERCRYRGKDLYYVLVDGRHILAYGMLRGWDDGYAVPSLGIAVHPVTQGRGLGCAFMHFLHVAARHHGAKQIRLKVHKDNLRAIRLYQRLGYVFGSEEAGQLVGTMDL